MESNLTSFIICLCFVTGVFFCQYVFYGTEINYLIDGSDFSNPEDEGYIPFISEVTRLVGWVFLALQIFFSLLVFDFAVAMPIEIKMIILIPFWGALIYIMIPIILKTGEVIARGIDAIIPF